VHRVRPYVIVIGTDHLSNRRAHVARARALEKSSMGNHRDAEITEMVVVLDKRWENNLADALEQLKKVGMEIYSADDDNSVVEGAAESHKVHDIEKLDCVDYVRKVMTYIADYPPGDPRDKDGIEE
jgi:hypothetical protein